MVGDLKRNLSLSANGLEEQAHLFCGNGLLLKYLIICHVESSQKTNFYNEYMEALIAEKDWESQCVALAPNLLLLIKGHLEAREWVHSRTYLTDMFICEWFGQLSLIMDWRHFGIVLGLF
jgi:hypothetical protein